MKSELEIGEYTTKEGYEAVVKFVIPNCESVFDRAGMVKENTDCVWTLCAWTKNGKADRGYCGEYNISYRMEKVRIVKWYTECNNLSQTEAYDRKDVAEKRYEKLKQSPVNIEVEMREFVYVY